VVPDHSYLVLKGVNEEYVYHPPPPASGRSINLLTLQNWLIGRILTGVHRRPSSRMSVDTNDIMIYIRGKILSSRTRVLPGETIEFDLTRGVEDKFVEEEAWLVPLTETCVVCSDDKRVSEMPRRITRSCEHPINTCKTCVGQWIKSSMDTLAWDRLKCPDCPQLLRYDDVRAFASPETFKRSVCPLSRFEVYITLTVYRYDNLAMKAAVTDIRNFKWCLNPRCNSGQIHRTNCSKVKCHACKAASCAHHDLPWHSGETCEQYDKRTRRQRKGDKASEKKIKEITKACPQCQRDVHKYSGCDHITCKFCPI
jgi:hypothetical protein